MAETVDDDRPGTPILYLPGVALEDLRAVEECPAELAPVAELQYRSRWFAAPKGREWSVRALFIDGNIGLGLRIADGKKTAEALRAALPMLLELPVAKLTGDLLDAKRLHDILNPDPVGGILEWIDDPGGHRARLDSDRWAAFVQQCRSQFDFDPGADGEITAARMLGEGKGSWDQVWDRFRASPSRYPNLPERLRQARPQEMFTGVEGRWPQDNLLGEDAARRDLLGFADLPAAPARACVTALGPNAATRRTWVWADLGEAPLAFAIEHLGRLAAMSSEPLAGPSVSTMADAYLAWGWQVDDAVVKALASVERPEDVAAVSAAIQAIYRPWLHEAAACLQSLIGPMANAGTYEASNTTEATASSAIVFVDGLRLDVGHRLASRLRDLNVDVDLGVALAALPTVTETAKPALAPIQPGALCGGPELFAARSSSGTKATKAVLESLMAEHAVQVLTPGEVGVPGGTAWTEAGAIDHRGHDLGLGVARVLDAEIDAVARRVRDLLHAGWSQVSVVTDHGWLLLPGGLPKVELPVAVVEKRKGRCARLKDGAAVEVSTVPWRWDADVRIALAPGACCFESGKTYEHGGVSPQECIVPRLTTRVTAAPVLASTVTIESVKWLGLQCRVQLRAAPDGARVDIRATPGNPTTSVANEAKETVGDGRVSLIVPDDELEGEPGYVVVIGPVGSLLAQRQVTIGVNQ